jgi:N-methylhydantoinase A
MAAIKKAGIKPEDIDFFAHGSTVVINAITERKGARTGLITTAGFRDILEIARGNRPDFFNLRYQKPTPFVPRYLRREISERITCDGGVRLPLDIAGLAPLIDFFRAEGVEAIAICLLHAYANPVHEIALLGEVRKLWPEVSVVASHQITREWREYERTNTSVLSAYVQPLASRYLEQLDDKLKGKGLPAAPFIMQSNGGIDTVTSAQLKPITLVESGPASGVLAAAALGRLIGEENIIAFDIGGTTAKCSLIDKGEVRITTQYMIEKSGTHAGYPIMTPVVDLVEIGNGGGSIAWVDSDCKLHVGPQSAGAAPGPAAYGRGGKQPTTTDANLLTGRIDPDYFMGGERQADMAAVAGAFASVAGPLGLTIEEAARGVIRIANNNMINALKLVSVNRGYDPRDFTMIAFGGGGAMHAATLAKELNIPKVIVPINSSVFSAWGMLMSDLRRDYVMTRLTVLGDGAEAEINAVLHELESHARLEYEKDGFGPKRVRFERYGNFRYVGQEHTVKVKLPDGVIPAAALAKIAGDFHDGFEREYTYRLPNEVQLVGFQLTAFGAIAKPDIPRLSKTGKAAETAVKGRRRVDFDIEGIHLATIYNSGALAPDMTFTGPAIVEDPGTTIVILPGQNVRVDDYGNLHIETGARVAP